jgi:hypothetical protein
MQFCKDSKRQRSRLSKAWLSFLKLPLPLDIYKKVSSLQFLCICFVLTMLGFKLQLISGLRSCLRHSPGTILGIGTWKQISPDALDAIALLCTENLVDCKPNICGHRFHFHIYFCTGSGAATQACHSLSQQPNST